MADEAWIYALADQYGVPRYIGKARDPIDRAKRHVRETVQRDYPVHRWLRKQMREGRPVQVMWLERCDEAWRDRERLWIAAARAAGVDLLNVAAGGDQPECPVEVRRRNAAVLNEKMQGNSLLCRLRSARSRRTRRNGR